MKEILKDKNFLLIIMGKFVSLFGSSVYQIGLIWYVLSKYGEDSGGILAWIMILGILPSVLLGGAIGSVIDRLNKKWIMVVSDVISGFVVIGVTAFMYADKMNTVYLLIATAALSITESFVGISVTTLIPELYEEEKLYTANSINQFVDRITLLIGLSVGGAMIGLMGIKQVFIINSVSFFLSAMSEAFIIYKWNRIDKIRAKLGDMFSDFRDVLHFIRENTNVLMITILFSMVNVLWDPLFGIVFPYSLKNDFLISSGQFGLIESAFPAGFCIGAVYFSTKSKLLKGKDVMFYSILGANMVLAFMTIPLILMSPANSWVLVGYFMILLIILGLFSSAINISSSVAMQVLVPQGLRGKYYGFARSISRGLIPIGSAVIGTLIGRVRPSVFFIVSILLVFLIVLLVPRKSYRLSKVEQCQGV